MSAVKHQPIPLTTYVMVWVALLVLTGVTVTAASLHMGAWSVLGAIAIAAIKGTLVLAYFMHLKYEDLIFRIMLGVAVLTLVIIMALTFFDVLLR